MSLAIDLKTPAALTVAAAPATPAFTVPARRNPRLQALAERLNADEELQQLWRCANVNALDRLGLGDHGEVHVRIVANAALRLLRLLRAAGRAPGVAAQYQLAAEEAEVVVVLAAALHDVDLAAQPGGGGAPAAALTGLKARELLAALYPARERTILVSETLQAIAAHKRGACLTLEAGVLHLADALDIAEGRLQPELGRAQAARVETVTLRKGAPRPVRVEVRLSERAGAAEVGRLLARRAQEAGLADAVEVVGRAGDGPAFSLNGRENRP